MIPITQLNRHDPDNGIWGDCWSTCIASILEVPREDVPHFYDKGRSGVAGRNLARKWLKERGLTILSTVYMGELDLDDILYAQSKNNPDTYFILSGTSRNGTCHAVVALNDAIVWDPAIDKSGIVGPCEPMNDDPDCGLYYIEYIGSAVALNKVEL